MKDQFDKIDAYLRNKLSKDDKKLFEQQMSENPSLVEAVEQQKDAIRVLEAVGDHELKLQIKKALQDRDQKVSSVKKLAISWQVVAGIAAGFLVLILALWFLFSKPSPESLFANNYEIYTLNEGSRNNDTDLEIRAAVDLYQQSKFEEVLPLLKNIYQFNKDSKWLIAQAVSLIETKQYQQAIDVLSSVRANENDFYQNPALWYTAMAYLKLNDQEKSIENIQLLSTKEPDLYSKKAKVFLESL